MWWWGSLAQTNWEFLQSCAEANGLLANARSCLKQWIAWNTINLCGDTIWIQSKTSVEYNLTQTNTHLCGIQYKLQCATFCGVQCKTKQKTFVIRSVAKGLLANFDPSSKFYAIRSTFVQYNIVVQMQLCE